VQLVADASADAELSEFLRSLGATDEQIDEARRECHLSRLATDVVLNQGAVLGASQLAARAGVATDRVLELWRTLGVAPPGPDEPYFSERDAAFTTEVLCNVPLGSGLDEVLRVLGSSLARVAEAAVSLYVQTVEPDLDSPDVDLVAWARDLAATTELGMRLGDSMGPIFAHHLHDAIARQRLAQAERTERSLFRLAVGFVDLVGFTPFAQHSAPADLVEMIGRFEARAFEVAATRGGRVVKHIGDEVMFVALDPATGCAIAEALLEVAGAGDIAPRGGVALGEVISRHGDYYGPVVNLASRLAELAIPGEILVDEATAASAAAAAFSFRPAGRRLLKGFDQPVEAFALVPGDAGP